MKTKLVLSAGLVPFIAATSLLAYLAQEPPKPLGDEKEHQWLAQFVGEWEAEIEGVAAPGQSPMRCKGGIRSRMLGEIWVVNELKTEMQGAQVDGLQTIGYDPKSKKHVSTWIDSTGSYLWRYEGSVDATGKILTLEAEGPNMILPDKQSRYRDAYEFKSKDHMVATSSILGDDGKWSTFMTGNARRKK